MKALTLKQPWASLVAKAFKTIELRTTRTKYRGKLAIHAGKTFDYYALYGAGVIHPFNKVYTGNEHLMPTGAILAICELYDVIEFTGNTALFRKFKDQHCYPWTINKDTKLYGWRLQAIRILKYPVPCRGMPGMFNLNEKEIFKDQIKNLYS
jgi:hypothetical protein